MSRRALGSGRLRFLVLTQYFAPEIGAPQTRLAALVRELARAGHDVQIVTALPNYPTGKILPAYRGKWFSKAEWEGIPVIRVWLYASTGAGVKRMANYLSFTLSSLVGLARARRPDYLFVESPPLTLCLSAAAMARLWRCKLVVNVADLWPQTALDLGLIRDGMLLKLLRGLEHWAYRRADAVNAATSGIRDALRRTGVPDAKVLFLPNGADTVLFAPRAPDATLACELGLNGKDVILYAGTLGYVHGFDVAIEAMHHLRHRSPTAMLLVVGDGSEQRRLTQKARELELANVQFLPPQPPEFIARLYNLACAGLVTIRDQPSADGIRPSKLFPIMSSGRPVIYSGLGEGAKLVTQAAAGFVVPPSDGAALAEAIERVIREPQAGADMGARGRVFVVRHFTWGDLIGAWLRQLQRKCPDGQVDEVRRN